MPEQHDAQYRQDRVRKRTVNACNRCRRQKIRCNGLQPCEQCSKRNLRCSFDNRSQKILVSRGYIEDLTKQAEQRATPREDETFRSSLDNTNDLGDYQSLSHGRSDHFDGTLAQSQRNHENNVVHDAAPVPTDSGRTTPLPPIDNLFSTHNPRYVADSAGRSWYLGTSSNWAFGRHVLNIAHEQLTGQPVPAQHTMFDGTLYDLGWDGQREVPASDTVALPTADHAIYLINAVKFHCGQMFHLFDEVSFMVCFHDFYGNVADDSRKRDLWYVHFLLILAFGKVFVARRRGARRPPGADFFLQATKLKPDITYLCTEPLEAVEILCCEALYLHCLDFRNAAHCVIGQALRICLSEGMHTNMKDKGLKDSYVQRCRNVWWTVYILDRQMASLMGVPLAIRDQDITAALPTFSDSPQRALALELNIKLSRVISRIMNTVYGHEGRLSRSFITSTKAALKDAASVTDQLKKSFDLPVSGSAGISRLASHLHLLLHRCIVLATQPLLFSLLKSKLDRLSRGQSSAPSSGSTRTLLQMCIQSAQHMIAILSRLEDQNLLEGFLPFDSEAVFAASMAVLIGPIVDSSLIESHSSWLSMAFSIFDELINQGHLQAGGRKAELQQLQHVFNQMAASPVHQQNRHHDHPLRVVQQTELLTDSNTAVDFNELDMSGADNFDFGFIDDALWRSRYTTDQLMNVVETLDLDGIEWMTTGSSGLVE